MYIALLLTFNIINGLITELKEKNLPSPKDTKGPVVKTGPTAGQNRTRNDNGEWRKKRSDAGKPRSK